MAQGSQTSLAASPWHGTPKSWDFPESEEHKDPQCLKSMGSCLPRPVSDSRRSRALQWDTGREQLAFHQPWEAPFCTHGSEPFHLGVGRMGPLSYCRTVTLGSLTRVCIGGQTLGR